MQQNSQNSSQLDLQRAASDPRNSVWVFASAGSGKTKILIDRLLRLLLLGSEPSKILCLTYTKVAAAEMQNRISNELANWVIFDDETLRQKLRELTNSEPSFDLINQARGLLAKTLDQERPIKIQTIHSFCQSLLSSFPFEAKISAKFELLTDGQVAIALKKAQKKLLAEALLSKENSQKSAEIESATNANFSQKQQLHEIIEEISRNTNEESLMDLLAKILAKKDELLFLREKFQTIESLIDELAKILKADLKSSEQQIFENFWQKIDQQNLQDLCASLNNSKVATNKKYGADLTKFLSNPQSANFNFLHHALLTNDDEGGFKLKKLYDKIDLQYQEFLQDFFEKTIDYLQQISSFLILKHNSQLLHFIYLIFDRYQEFKQQNGYLDYQDLILLASQLLSDSEHRDFIKMKMDGQFDHILIDESQDTNAKQWQIVKMLTEDFLSAKQGDSQHEGLKLARSIFVVGDEKQSIFSFQGADLRTAADALEYFRQKIDKNFKEIALNLSFRSKAKILQAVDLVFADEDRRKGICKIGNYQPHQSFRGVGGHVELWEPINCASASPKKDEKNHDFSWQLEKFDDAQQGIYQSHFKPEQESTLVYSRGPHDCRAADRSATFKINQNPKDFDQELRNCQIMAQLIAKRISSWIASKKTINKKNSDKVAEDVDFLGGEPLRYGDIMILLHNKTNGLAQSLAAEFARQKIPFSTVEKVKFSESLAIQDFLACARFVLLPEDDFNLACLLKSPFFNLGEEELLEFACLKNHQKIPLFAALKGSKHWHRLLEMQNFAKNLSSFEFFYRLIFEPKTYHSFLQRMGSQVQNIIENFFFCLDEFSTQNNSELQLFLEFVEKTDPQITTDSGDKNAVRITTIHSAKGLQAPIVIMPDCLHNLASLRANTENLIWLENLPLCPPVGTKHNFLIQAIKERRKKANFEEYLRLLYVAMTRAEDELYIGGFGAHRDENCWYNIIEKTLPSSWSRVDLQEEMAAIADSSDLNFKNFEESQTDVCFDKQEMLTNPWQEELRGDEFGDFALDDSLVEGKYESEAMEFGKIIHSALELIGRNYRQNREFIKKLLANFIAQQPLSIIQKQELEQILANFLQSTVFEKIFGSEVAECPLEIACEVELIADGKIGRIDLLRKNGDEIDIIDYKSDEFLPKSMPQSYRNQLVHYVELAKKIFPQKKIKAAILWVLHCELWEI